MKLHNFLQLTCLFLLIHNWAIGQCPTEQITLSTQAQIDAFAQTYPNCTELSMGINIQGQASSEIPISNLFGLEQITRINGSLSIENTRLSKLTGLESLKFIGGTLSLFGNTSLTTLKGLDNLTTIEEDFSLFFNTTLEEIGHLARLTSVGRDFILFENPILSNLNGLQQLKVIGGDFALVDNFNLSNIDGFIGVQSIGKGITIDGNAVLSSLGGLANVSSIGGRVEIIRNTDLTSCQIEILCTYFQNGNEAIINNNGTGCSSSEEIVLACNNDPCTDNPSTVDFSFTAVGNTVLLTVDTSNAPNTINYIWTFGDGASGSGLTPTNTYTYAEGGTYTITLETMGDCDTPPIAKEVTVGNASPENTLDACSDNLDNDLDGLIDAEDSDCICILDSDNSAAGCCDDFRAFPEITNETNNQGNASLLFLVPFGNVNLEDFEIYQGGLPFPIEYSIIRGRNGILIDSLNAGSYSFTVTHLPTGCYTFLPIFDIENIDCSDFSVSIEETENTCANITYTARLKNGTPPFQYSWTTDATNNNSFFIASTETHIGTQQLTVTDANGCQGTQLFTVIPATTLQSEFSYELTLDSILFTNQSIGNINEVQWIFNTPDAIVDNKVPLPPVGEYQICLAVTNECNLQNTSCQTIIIEEENITCPIGNVVLTTQEEVDAFIRYFANCPNNTLDGRLTLEGENITDISGLSILHNITGQLLIKNTSLINLNGLSNLKTTETINVEDNPKLLQISGLGGLQYVGNLFIIGNQSLSIAAGIDKIKQIEFTLQLALNGNIGDCSSLLCPIINGPNPPNFISLISNGPSCSNLQEIYDICAPEELMPEDTQANCSDTIDNDGDGLVDSLDPDCSCFNGSLSNDCCQGITFSVEIDGPINGLSSVLIRPSEPLPLDEYEVISSIVFEQTTEGFLGKNISTGAYTCTIRNETIGCDTAFTIRVPSDPACASIAANFTFQITDEVILFQDRSTGPIINPQWISNLPQAINDSIVTRPPPGTYEICRIVANACGDIDEFCSMITINPISPPVNDIFSDYPILLDYVNPTTCTDEKITVYKSGTYTYFYIEAGSNQQLYNILGQPYCKSGLGLNCLEYYTVDEILATYDCSNNPTTEDQDQDGVLSDIDPDDTDPCVPNAVGIACMPPTPLDTPTIFKNYPFLFDLVDFTNCTDEKITAYLSVGYPYVFVESGTSNILYNGNGTRYCANGPGLNCLEYYRVDEILKEWVCTPLTPVDLDQDGTLSDTDPDDSDPCVPNNTVANCDLPPDGPTEPPFIDQFPFLVDLIDFSDCEGAQVTAYMSFGYPYVYIETTDSGILYNGIGTKYCTSGQGLVCTEAYAISEEIGVWNCSKFIPPGCTNTTTGTIVLDNCTDGTIFFLLRLADGTLLDPYFAEEIEFDYFDGQVVNFQSTPADFDSPCRDGLSAVTITCIEETPIEPQDNGIFDTYPFLSNIVDITDCSGEKITAYLSGGYPYVYVEKENSSILYNANGDRYCRSRQDLNCLEYYSVDEIVDEWTCNGGIIKGDCSKYSGNIVFKDCDDGTPFFFIELADGTLLDLYFAVEATIDLIDGLAVNFDYVPANFPAPCSIAEQAINVTCIEAASIPPPAIDTSIFSDYPFLSTLVDPFACSNEKITAYLSGGYPYVYVEKENNSILYNANGNRYCKSGQGLNCLEYYTVDEILEEWTCISIDNLVDKDQDGYTLLEDLNDNDPCIPDPNSLACDTPTQNDQLFVEYPFLRDLVDPDTCTTDSILVYTSAGNATYFFVAKAESGILYNTDGVRYCGNYTNYNCLDFYVVENVVEIWSCGNPSPFLPIDQDQEETFEEVRPEIALVKETTPVLHSDFQMYPNPSRGPIFIDLSTMPIMPKAIVVQNIRGQVLLTKQISDSGIIELNLTGQATGVYFVQVQSSDGIITKRIVLR